jgi:hypothetical protein
MSRRPRLTSLLVAFPLAATGSAIAQTRPLVTETAVTAPAGTVVFETGFDLITAEPSYLNGVERTRWDGPLLRLTYSPADSVELDVEWVAGVGVIGEPGRGDVPSADFGDVSLRAKWRLAGGGPGGPALAARFGVTLPQTSYEDVQHRPLGLGPNTIRAFAEGLATRPVGRGHLVANLGLLLFDDVYRPHEQVDFFTYGAALDWPVAGRLAAVAEVAGRTGHPTPGAPVRAEARAGLRYARERLRLDAALRYGIATADGSWGVTAGMGYTLRPR